MSDCAILSRTKDFVREVFWEDATTGRRLVLRQTEYGESGSAKVKMMRLSVEEVKTLRDFIAASFIAAGA